MNDTTKRPRIKLAIEWLRGLRMDIPHSKWVMFSIGVYVLAAAFDKVAAAVGTLIQLLH